MTEKAGISSRTESSAKGESRADRNAHATPPEQTPERKSQ